MGNNRIKYFFLAFSLILAGCGGGGSNDSNSSSSNNNTHSTGGNEILKGGTLVNPEILISTKKYLIGPNNFYNYFTYSGTDKETIFLKVNFDLPFTMQNRRRCRESIANGYLDTEYPITRMYDNKNKLEQLNCYEDVKYTFDSSNKKIFQVVPAYRGNGILNFAAVKGNAAIIAPVGEQGSPSNPILVKASNKMNHNSFYNYFKYSAKAGETIHLSVFLDTPLTDRQLRRCREAESDLTLNKVSGYSTDLYIYDDNYNYVKSVCDTEVKYTFSKDGTYIFSFNFEGAGNSDDGGNGTGTIYFESLCTQLSYN